MTDRASEVSPELPAGFRDWAGRPLALRKGILRRLEQLFQGLGFQPLETPALERLDVLLAKYGEEASRLIFRIVRSGNFLEGVPEDLLAPDRWNELLSHITRLGLRYDLTVPMARYVSAHVHDLPFPFRRYQIQPVWRAERPQRGRFREFIQCDFDILGADEPYADAEVLWILEEGFRLLHLQSWIRVRVNDRRVLEEVLAHAGVSSDAFLPVCHILDKLERDGRSQVESRLRAFLPEEAVTSIFRYLDSSDIGELVREHQLTETTANRFQQILSLAQEMGASHLVWDPSLVRGLDYYTGMVCEVELQLPGARSSIAGGGRYDHLTDLFGVEGIQGVGASFGVDRLTDYLLSLVESEREEASSLRSVVDSLVHEVQPSLSILAIPLDVNAYRILWRVRQILWKDSCIRQNVTLETLPPGYRLRKALRIASRKNVHYVLIVGEEEIRQHQVLIRNMISGEQTHLSIKDEVRLRDWFLAHLPGMDSSR